MPFRATFSCLWCGETWSTRDTADLEGWAQLCPTCLGKAGDNEFLRFRLRAAMEERARARAAGPTAAADQPLGPAPTDDWYLRRGTHARGAIDDARWAAELDSATLWLDALPLSGELVEPAAGEGWWSPLLAGKGELWAYDADPAALDRARSRLLAHGLRAHLHLRDPWAEPDRTVDAVVVSFRLGRLVPDRWPEWLSLARRWLRPGGRFVSLEIAGPAQDPDGPQGIDPATVVEAFAAGGLTVIELGVGGSILRAVATA
jgi:SAM-dependent methyltransferase